MLVLNRLVGQGFTIGPKIAVYILDRNRNKLTIKVSIDNIVPLTFDCVISKRDRIQISKDIVLEIIGNRGNQIQIGIDAPLELEINRLN